MNVFTKNRMVTVGMTLAMLAALSYTFPDQRDNLLNY